MTNFDRRLHRIEAELPPDSGLEWLRPAWERHGSAWDVVKRRMHDPGVQIDPSFMARGTFADKPARRFVWCVHSDPEAARALDAVVRSFADAFACNQYGVDTVLTALNERTRTVAGDQSIDLFPYLSKDLARALWAIYIAEDQPTWRIHNVLAHLVLDGVDDA